MVTSSARFGDLAYVRNRPAFSDHPGGLDSVDRASVPAQHLKTPQLHWLDQATRHTVHQLGSLSQTDPAFNS